MSTSNSEPVLDLEHHVRQRLALLEDAVARTAHMRSRLKDSADLVKQEIRECFGQLLCLLRSREQQLLSSLDTVATVKDDILTQQQDQLHQALGAYQHSLDCLASASDASVRASVSATLERLCALELKPLENAHLAFEADVVSLRRFLQTFGRISSSRALKTQESLPIHLEDYDEEPGLLYKSFHRKPLSAAGRWPACADWEGGRGLREALTGDADAVSCLPRFAPSRPHHKHPVRHWWLTHIGNTVENEPAVFEDFEILREEAKPLFQTINQSPEKSQLFSEYFRKMSESSLSEWTSDCVETSEPMEEEEKEEKKNRNCSERRPPSPNNPDEMNRFRFESVIRDIVNSDKTKWLPTTD